MLDVMAQAKDAIEAYNEALKASSSNIANMNVVGYKRIDVSFQSVFARVLNQGTPARGNMGGTNPQQTGPGMGVSNVAIDFSAGDLIEGGNLDLAITGQGLFIVSADNGQTFRYTRAGKFQIDVNGNLTVNNMQVYGLNNAGSLVAISGLTSAASQYSWQSDGRLLNNGTPDAYRIALTYFANPGGLTEADGTSFVASQASGAAATASEPNSTVGGITPNKLEQSNVFYLGESIDALEIQRAMSGNLTMVRLASDIISNFIKSLGG